MDGLGIGEVARRAGVQPSAIRYYESAGVLPAARRVSGRRRYDEAVLDRLAVVRLAQQAGFTVAEIRALVAGFDPGTPPAARWQALATRKLAEVDELLAHARRMRTLLERALACACLRLEDCTRVLSGDGACRQGRARPGARRGARPRTRSQSGGR